MTGTLLKEAGQLGDAVRVISEATASDPIRVASELRHWDRVEDAKRVEALKARSSQ